MLSRLHTSGLIRPELILVPVMGCRATPSINLPLPIYTTESVIKCLDQEHIVMSPVRTGTQTTRSKDERTNHEATTPPMGNLQYGP